MSDFAPSYNHASSALNLSNATVRPTSTATARSDATRSSKYSSSLGLSDSRSHYSQTSLHPLHRHGVHDDFEFPRPSNDEVEALFEHVRQTRDLGAMPDLNIDRKWQIVYNDEHIRWKDEKKLEETRKYQDAGQTYDSVAKESPEWYIKKFLDKSITVKQVSSLHVSLRTSELW